jgi:hypothetical protein
MLSRLRARSAGRPNRKATGHGAAAAWGCPLDLRKRCWTSCDRSGPDRIDGIRCRPLSRHLRGLAGHAREGHDSRDREPNRRRSRARDFSTLSRRVGPGAPARPASGRRAREPACRCPARARCTLESLRAMRTQSRRLRSDFGAGARQKVARAGRAASGDVSPGAGPDRGTRAADSRQTSRAGAGSGGRRLSIEAPFIDPPRRPARVVLPNQEARADLKGAQSTARSSPSARWLLDLEVAQIGWPLLRAACLPEGARRRGAQARGRCRPRSRRGASGWPPAGRRGRRAQVERRGAAVAYQADQKRAAPIRVIRSAPA